MKYCFCKTGYFHTTDVVFYFVILHNTTNLRVKRIVCVIFIYHGFQSYTGLKFVLYLYITVFRVTRDLSLCYIYISRFSELHGTYVCVIFIYHGFQSYTGLKFVLYLYITVFRVTRDLSLCYIYISRFSELHGT